MVQFANRITRLTPSPIREILNVIDQPGMVSFAGGLPDADTLPEIAGVDLTSRQLQYGASEGDTALREQVALELQARGIKASAQRVLILSGSQQGIDLVAKLLVEPGTTVAVESPTYLAALQVFSLFGAEYSNFKPEQAEQILEGNAPRLIYSIPSFQNPTGHCYSAQQRAALLAVHAQTDAVLFEDDPYGELAYESCDTRPLCADVQAGCSWVYQSSFSKTLAPGIRLGFITCSEDLWPKLVQLKQAADLHSNRVGQQIALALLQDEDREQRMQDLIARYRNKRDTFERLLQQHFAGLASWQCPKGGLFFWLTLNSANAIDTRELLPKAIEQGVAFMPGEPFYAVEKIGRNTLRLNFSQANADDADRGLATLAGLIKPLL
jgi:DNA-binding transcriptional MocR family regulator